MVPPAVSQSFNLLIPIMIVLAVMAILNFIFSKVTTDGIQVIIYSTIQAPLTSLGSSMGTIIVFVVVQQLLWVLGIHGPNTLSALRSVIWTEQGNANLAYVAQHGSAWGAPFPINWGSINDAFVMVVDLVLHSVLLSLSLLWAERINHNMKLPRCHLCLDYLTSMNLLSLVYQLL